MCTGPILQHLIVLKLVVHLLLGSVALLGGVGGLTASRSHIVPLVEVLSHLDLLVCLLLV